MGSKLFTEAPLSINARTRDRAARPCAGSQSTETPGVGNDKGSGTSAEKRGGGGSTPSPRTKFPATHAPEHVTRSMCSAVEVEPQHTVLEPSAGAGRMVRVIKEFTEHVTAIELNADLHRELQMVTRRAYRRDFLRIDPNKMNLSERHIPFGPGLFDRIIMCPPAQSDEHITHALKFLAPGGRLIALVQEVNIDLSRWPKYHRLSESFTYGEVKLFCGTIVLEA